MTRVPARAAVILLTVWWGCAPLSGKADVELVSQSLQLQFSERGDLLFARACFPGCDAREVQFQALSSSRGLLVFAKQISPHRDAPWRADSSREDGATVLTFSNAAGQWSRRWHIPDRGWRVKVTANGSDSLSLMGGEHLRPPPSSGFGYLLEQQRYLVFDDGGVEITGLDETGQVAGTAAGWLGFRNRFWAVMVLPEAPAAYRLLTGDEVADARVDIQLKKGGGQSLQLYLGPVEPVALQQADPELGALMYSGLWFWLRWLCQALYFLLDGIHRLIPHWGLAVMALSVLVGVLMRPLNNIAERLQDQVHRIDARLAPALAAIKRDYKGGEQSEKILALYKEEGVHPLYSLKSLAGVFVVIPVFIGAFDMLAENIHLSGEAFLWITDLSRPDAFHQLPFSLPFFGPYLNLLPFIMTAFSFVASKLHQHPEMDDAWQRRHARNLLLMSLGFLVLFYTFPAGMVLYWTTNNLLSVIKTGWKRRRQKTL